MLICINRNAEVLGPYSIEEAREYLFAGRLSLLHLARLPGTTEWIPLGSVPGVKSAPPPFLRRALPLIFNAPRPTGAGPNGAVKRIPQNESPVWNRAKKRAESAFGIGVVAGAITAANTPADVSSWVKLIVDVIAGVFTGLLVAVATYIIAGLYYATMERRHTRE